jgi:5-methylthioadenosine/S-adenosylhomocysteine deaminase
MLIVEADWLVPSAGDDAVSGSAVAIKNGRIMAMGRAEDLVSLYPKARHERFPDAVVMPGFVNAHQHGRGLSQIQLGYPDDALEPWIARRRGRAVPDVHLLTLLAAEEMLAHGVTSTLHANYSYASGDYEAELRASISAYEIAGLRATVCVGYADRGELVYPPTDASTFTRSLSSGARALLDDARPAWLPLDATQDLMGRLQNEYAGHPTITLAYGPAGPQWVSDDAWRALAADAARRDVGLHFHLLESPAQARACREIYPEGVLCRLEALGTFAGQASAAHFTQATPEEARQAARLGLVIVANPGSNMRLRNGAPRLDMWQEAGMIVALGTDNCALQDDEDYLAELRLGDLLARGRGQGGPGGASAAMFAMGTDAGARASFCPTVGRLTPGMRADLIVFDLTRMRGGMQQADFDLATVTARGRGEDVLLTVVEGRECYRRGPEAAERRRRLAVAAATAAAPMCNPDLTTRRAGNEISEALRRHYAGERA